MKKYKKKNFDFYIYNYDKFIKSKLYLNIYSKIHKIFIINKINNYLLSKNIHKDLMKCIIIFKNKKFIGFLYGITYKNKIRNNIRGISIYNYILNIRTQKDYLLILEKLYQINGNGRIDINVNSKDKLFQKTIKKLDLKKWDYVTKSNGNTWLFT
tara:strand:+ start:107 stop:571 length:465 start_codon:yes stop_codon:yes gene_type:complete